MQWTQIALCSPRISTRDDRKRGKERKGKERKGREGRGKGREGKEMFYITHTYQTSHFLNINVNVNG
jgi:hypothetical protein